MALQVEESVERQEDAVRRHVITIEEYERMCAADVFEPDARIELIRGVIVDMPPPGTEHTAAVSKLSHLLRERLGRRALVWPQGNPIQLPGSESLPQPDGAVLVWDDDHYAHTRPQPEDTILVIEVSDSTLRHDRSLKLALYAEAGIPAYWVVNVRLGVVEVYEDPDRATGKYRSTRKFKRGERIELPAKLGVSISVDEVFGPMPAGDEGTQPEPAQ